MHMHVGSINMQCTKKEAQGKLEQIALYRQDLLRCDIFAKSLEAQKLKCPNFLFDKVSQGFATSFYFANSFF